MLVLGSLSARRAWIEINHHKRRLRDGLVALRKESVDRNLLIHAHIVYVAVALRKESVDRNRILRMLRPLPGWSLSARRAWIEILRLITLHKGFSSRSPQGERG